MSQKERASALYSLRQGFVPVMPPTLLHLEHGGERIALVRHPSPAERRAIVVLAGPLGLERSFSYLSWMKLARLLAAAGYESWLFDWRGQGESTGDFTAFNLEDWQSDLDFVMQKALNESGEVALVGLRLGGLLASRSFAKGLGRALVIWDPIDNGEAMLMGILRRKLTSEAMEGLVPKGTTRQTYVDAILRGETVIVEAFPWTNRLWLGAKEVGLTLPLAHEKRPWLCVHLAAQVPPAFAGQTHHQAVAIPLPPFWTTDPMLIPALDPLFLHLGQWLDDHVPSSQEEERRCGTL